MPGSSGVGGGLFRTTGRSGGGLFRIPGRSGGGLFRMTGSGGGLFRIQQEGCLILWLVGF